MAAIFGFNVGAVISLGDMEQTIEYISENTDKEVKQQDRDVTSKFMLSDLPFPINKDAIDYSTGDLRKDYDDEDEFDIDDSEFDDIIDGDDFDKEEETDVNIGDSLEIKAIDKRVLIDNLKNKVDSKPKPIEDDEITRLKQELEKERRLREQREAMESENERKKLEEQLKIEREQNRIRSENEKKKLEEQLKIEREKNIVAENKLNQQMKQKQEQLEELREQKRKELVDKKRRELEAKAAKKVQEEPVNIYDTLEIDALYIEVRKYMEKSGVNKSIVAVKYLNDKFGRHNIKKLILKSYLISIGKGVTIGR